METKETSSRTESVSTMLQDSEYYKYIFKKTEKIACAVFYILRGNSTISHTDTVIAELEKASETLSDVSLESLRSTPLTVSERATEVSHALIRLESKLRIAHSARLLGGDILEVFLHEINSVQRSLRRYVEPSGVNPLSVPETPALGGIRERKPSRIEGARTPRGEAVGEAGPGRRERVITVIRDKGEASIKDIVEVVTDCSEKTIQRELNSLIKDSIVHREGERRWSKYKLVQG